jgi:hypothetical protein
MALALDPTKGMFDAEDQQDAEPIEGCLRSRGDIVNGAIVTTPGIPPHRTLLKMNLCRLSLR